MVRTPQSLLNQYTFRKIVRLGKNIDLFFSDYNCSSQEVYTREDSEDIKDSQESRKRARKDWGRVWV